MVVRPGNKVTVKLGLSKVLNVERSSGLHLVVWIHLSDVIMICSILLLSFDTWDWNFTLCNYIYIHTCAVHHWQCNRIWVQWFFWATSSTIDHTRWASNLDGCAGAKTCIVAQARSEVAGTCWTITVNHFHTQCSIFSRIVPTVTKLCVTTKRYSLVIPPV